jgi:hypothetical protein
MHRLSEIKNTCDRVKSVLNVTFKTFLAHIGLHHTLNCLICIGRFLGHHRSGSRHPSCGRAITIAVNAVVALGQAASQFLLSSALMYFDTILLIVVFSF